MRARGYAREECVAVGDSVEDVGVADVVGRFFLVANADLGGAPRPANAELTEGSMGEGFYEAVVRALAESGRLGARRALGCAHGRTWPSRSSTPSTS